SFRRARVFRRVRFGLLGTVVAADDNVLAADLDFDSLVLDVPVAHGALFRLHEALLEIRVIERLAAPIAGRSHEGMLAGAEIADFQILAHLAARLPFPFRTSEGERPNSRRKASVKWLWLEKLNSSAKAVRSRAPASSCSSAVRSRN